MNNFNIRCKTCGSDKWKLEYSEKFNNYHNDSYTDHFVYLVCCHCGYKATLYRYYTTSYS